MNWILSHLQIVVVAAVMLTYWINAARARARRGTSAPAPALDESHSGAEDPERTRRIQEEIRRKIAERRGTVPPAVPSAPAAPPPAPPLVAPRPVATPGGVLREKLEARLAQARARERAERERRRQEQEARARALAAEKLSAQRQALTASLAAREERPVAPVSDGNYSSPSPRRTWLDELREPDRVRRAVILREVLGPPVGLR
ncbi:MAG TPA: hypothetical protein VG838_13160 [Opitutaceae bacterium]|nr:hypothetical protein [Opitutaceae bacterium]